MKNFSKNEIILEQATIKDVGMYIRVESSVASKTYAAILDEKNALEELEKSVVYMIKIGTEIAGSISYQIKEDGSVYLSGLAVSPAFQGRGIGRQAIEKVLEKLKDVHKVTLVTHPDNSRAIALYTSLGFKIGERKENYFGDEEPRIELTLNR